METMLERAKNDLIKMKKTMEYPVQLLLSPLNNLSHIMPITDRRKLIKELENLINESEKLQFDSNIWFFYIRSVPILNFTSYIRAHMNITIDDVLTGKVSITSQKEKKLKDDYTTINSLLYEILDGAKCPISTVIMKDPVLAPDGHSYERSSLANWYKTCLDNKRVACCPINRDIPLTDPEKLLTNHSLKALILDIESKIKMIEKKQSKSGPKEYGEGIESDNNRAAQFTNEINQLSSRNMEKP